MLRISSYRLLILFLFGTLFLIPRSAPPAFAADEVTDDATADDATAADEPAADEGGGDGTVELMGEGGEEEEEPADEPAPAPRPKPKPKPKPAPKPRPKPRPAPPASPFEYRMIEDFEAVKPGVEPGVLRRAGPDPKLQFSSRSTTDAADGSARALVLSGVPAQADGTAWCLDLQAPLDLRGWRGISLRAKASRPTTELRLGAAGGGTVFASVLIGLDWTEVHLDVRLDPGRGRFDAAAVTGLAVTCAHELLESVDVTIDSIAAWRDRAPQGPERIGLNVPPLPGPLEWRALTESVNCAARASAADGLTLRCWSAPLPYQHWPNLIAFRELPRGLAGAVALVATVRAEPAQPDTFLKFTLVEEGGERFAAVRSAGIGALRIPLAEFLPDTVEMLRAAPAAADGRLDPAAVTGWTLEVLPTTERQVQGVVTVRELYAEGGMPSAPRPVPAPKPRAAPKPAPKPEPVAEPAAEEPATEEPAAEEPAPEEGAGEPDADIEMN